MMCIFLMNPYILLFPNCLIQWQLFILFLTLTLDTCFCFFPQGAALIELTGKVGGEVTFHCPVDKQKTLKMLYFQKGDDFVNGYYAKKDASKTAWRNTRLDLNKSTVHMSNLKPSHGGDYKCIIKYSGKIQMEPDVELRLTVTGMI